MGLSSGIVGEVMGEVAFSEDLRSVLFRASSKLLVLLLREVDILLYTTHQWHNWHSSQAKYSQLVNKFNTTSSLKSI
jgi:hypothetical protein